MDKLKTFELPRWPKLAWVAEWQIDWNHIVFLHGPMVETRDEWAAEAVWTGDFNSGNFDQTENVFGTGVRIRGNHAIFVSSGHTFDRLLYTRIDTKIFVSNTLPGLLAVTGLELLPEYEFYSKDSASIAKGLTERVRTIPTNRETIESVYYNNLELNLTTGNLIEQHKVDTAPSFDCYTTYRVWLSSISKELGANAADSNRKNPVKCLSGISSGYDSAVAAVVSREAGCRDTVTISHATSFWGKSDSGLEIAKYLGLTCKEYPRTSKHYSNEVALWAGEGRPGILNWTLFDYSEPLCLFFTGCHGEKVWDRVDHDHPDPFVRRDSSSHGFCEYRLWRGVFQCPVPFWGIRHVNEIKNITSQSEMLPWYMNKDYDKPIARRIAEEAGVARDIFGISNKNTSLESAFRWPISNDAQNSLNIFLLKFGLKTFSAKQIEAIRLILKFRHLIYQNFGHHLGWRHTEELSRKVPGYCQIYQWANSELAKYYYNEFSLLSLSL